MLSRIVSYCIYCIVIGVRSRRDPKASSISHSNSLHVHEVLSTGCLYRYDVSTELLWFEFLSLMIFFVSILGRLCAAASDSDYSYIFLRSVVCTSVYLSSVTFVHLA